jgi:hypothetical protein
VGPDQVQHSMARQPDFCHALFENLPALCATVKEWRLLNSPNQPPIYLSTPARRSMVHVDTNQGSSIATMNRKPPVLMSVKSTNK